jgi:hypothetical protein
MVKKVVKFPPFILLFVLIAILGVHNISAAPNVISSTAQKNTQEKIIQNCRLIDKKLSSDALVFLECKVQLTNSLATQVPQLPKAFEKIEDRIKQLIQFKEEELALWRERINQSSNIGFIFKIISIVITVLVISSTALIWMFGKLYPQLKETKNRLLKAQTDLENQKRLEIQLTEIQWLITSEYSDILKEQAVIRGIDVVLKLQRLLHKDENLVQASCNDLVQLLDTLPKAKHKISLYIISLLNTSLIDSKKSRNYIENKLLKNLMQNQGHTSNLIA